MAHRSRLLAGLALALAWPAFVAVAADDPPLPFRLQVTVVWGEPVGPESFRDAIQRRIVDELIHEACFDTVHTDPAAARRVKVSRRIRSGLTPWSIR